MNIGRTVVGGSAVVALVAAVGFGFTVFGPPEVSVDGANSLCISTLIPENRDVLVGVGVSNDGDSAIVLTAASVGSHDGIIVGDEVRAIPPSGGDFFNGIGSVSNTADNVIEFGLQPLAGLVVPPGGLAQVIFILKSEDGAGIATDFRIDFTGDYGMHHSATSRFEAGFTRLALDDENFGEPCGV